MSTKLAGALSGIGPSTPRITLTERQLTAYAHAILAFAVAYYAFLLDNGTFRPFAAEPLGSLFNDMGQRLLHWDFTIGKDVVREEAFIRDGHAYSYFAIFPAILRMPFILLGFPDLPLSRISCWTALSIAAFAQTSIVLLVCRTVSPARLRPALVLTCVAALLLTGPQLGLTFTSWVYNEPITWGGAFVLLFMRAIVQHVVAGTSPSARTWLAMGGLCGLALNTRATDGLTIAVGIAVAVLAFAASDARPRQRPLDWIAAVCKPGLLAACMMLPLVCVAFLVNWQRWGHPLDFMPLEFNVQFLDDPRRMRILKEVGSFSIVRVPVSILYYLFGMPRLPYVAEILDRYFDSDGYPRSLLILTSTASLAVTGYGAYRWAKSGLGVSRRVRLGLVTVACTALTSVALLLMLSYMNYRYRYAFVPFLCVGTALGVLGLSTLSAAQQRRGQYALAVLLACNLAVGHMDLLQAKLASFAMSATDRDELIHKTWPLPKAFGFKIETAANP